MLTGSRVELQNGGLVAGIAISCVIRSLVLLGILLKPVVIDKMLPKALSSALKTKKGPNAHWVPRKVYKTDPSAPLRLQTQEEIK